MTAKNDITGDLIKSGINTKQFEENFEKIFGDKDFQKRFNSKRATMALWVNDMDWHTRGGYIVRDPSNGEVIDRTKWIPKDYDFLNIKNAMAISFSFMRESITKAINGQPLTDLNKQVVIRIMDYHDELLRSNEKIDI